MSSSNMQDDKQMGHADKDQRDKDHKTGANKQPGQRQQSTGESGTQPGGDHDRTSQQGGSGSDPNRKGGKV